MDARDKQNPESEYGVFCRIRNGVGVRFLLICWSPSLVSNFIMETKNDASVKCDFNVTIGFPNFQKFGFGLKYDIGIIFGVGVEFVGVGVDSESEIRDSAHL